jgi:predicted anti-sigma-YlaC factor YlaD
LSARLDGEAEPVPAVWTDEHLRGCAACRGWQQRASTLTRMLRVRPAQVTPDITDRVLAAAPRPHPRGLWWRAALVAVAIAQLALGVAQVLGVDTGMRSPAVLSGNMSAHLFDESTAWNLAMGLGMLWAGLRARTTAGFLPVLGGFLAVLGGFSVRDLIVGDVTPTRIISHGLLVVGFALVCVVHRLGRGDPVPGNAVTTDADGTTRDGTAANVDPGRSGDRGGARGRPPLRPASRRRAA